MVRDQILFPISNTGTCGAVTVVISSNISLSSGSNAFGICAVVIVLIMAVDVSVLFGNSFDDSFGDSFIGPFVESFGDSFGD